MRRAAAALLLSATVLCGCWREARPGAPENCRVNSGAQLEAAFHAAVAAARPGAVVRDLGTSTTVMPSGAFARTFQVADRSQPARFEGIVVDLYSHCCAPFAASSLSKELLELSFQTSAYAGNATAFLNRDLTAEQAAAFLKALAERLEALPKPSVGVKACEGL